MSLQRMFLAHPQAAGETYLQHMAFAFRFSARLMRASLAAFVHGVVPDLCETTASSTVLAMNDELRAHHAVLAHGTQDAAQRA